MELRQQIKSRPFRTTDEVLANALYTLGVPWEKNEQGLPMPCRNTYTLNVLRGIETDRAAKGQPPLGLRGKSLEEGIKIAFRAGYKGTTEYSFEMTPTLYAVIEGYDAMRAAITANTANDPAAAANYGTLTVAPDVAGQLIAILAHNRHLFTGSKNVKPIWQRCNPRSEERDAVSHGDEMSGAGCTTRGSYKSKPVRV